MKRLSILCLFSLFLGSCSSNVEFHERFFSFDTYIDLRTYEGFEMDIQALKAIFTEFSKEADNFTLTYTKNVYSINHTNEEVEISSQLYDALKKTNDFQVNIGSYFNMFLGSLSSKWKTALENGTILDDETIQNELQKVENTSLEFLEGNKVQRLGEGEIDLGATAKGYVLDLAKKYLDGMEISKYLINAGNSSILLGEKNTKDGLFTVKIKDLNNKYVEAKKCVISTSSISEQSVQIDGVTYSHIINPNDGQVTPLNDAVVVFSSEGLLGDILSTTMMMCSIEEIKSLERDLGVKTIVIRNHEVTYVHSAIDIKNG